MYVPVDKHQRIYRQKEDEVGPPVPGRAFLAQKHSLDEKPRTLRN